MCVSKQYYVVRILVNCTCVLTTDATCDADDTGHSVVTTLVVRMLIGIDMQSFVTFVASKLLISDELFCKVELGKFAAIFTEVLISLFVGVLLVLDTTAFELLPVTTAIIPVVP